MAYRVVAKGTLPRRVRRVGDGRLVLLEPLESLLKVPPPPRPVPPLLPLMRDSETGPWEKWRRERELESLLRSGPQEAGGTSSVLWRTFMGDDGISWDGEMPPLAVVSHPLCGYRLVQWDEEDRRELEEAGVTVRRLSVGRTE